MNGLLLYGHEILDDLINRFYLDFKVLPSTRIKNPDNMIQILHY